MIIVKIKKKKNQSKNAEFSSLLDTSETLKNSLNLKILKLLIFIKTPETPITPEFFF
jgi:hypothetical protein